MQFFTVCWTRQIPQAFLLAGQIARHYPGSTLQIAWLDEAVTVPDVPANVKWVPADAIPVLATLRQRYTQTELLELSRPFVARYLLEKDPLVFLHPESELLGTLDRMEALLAWQPAVLCSQWLRPHPDTHLPDSKFHLNYGTYFSGCWAVRPHPETDRLLGWWCHNLETRGGYQPCEGRGSDQLWLDMAPALFEGVGPVRDDAYGIHYANAFERTGATPLTLHYGGFDYREKRIPAYLTDRPVPAFFRTAAEAYARRVEAHPLYRVLGDKTPVWGLPDPPQPVGIGRQRWAARIGRVIRTINTWQPGFLFPQAQS